MKKLLTFQDPSVPYKRVGNYETCWYMRAAGVVSGDYCGVIEGKNSHWMLLGDVSGHGLYAGVLSLVIQGCFHSILRTMQETDSVLSPSRVNYLINQLLYEPLYNLGDAYSVTVATVNAWDDGSVFVSGIYHDIFLFRGGKRQIFELLPVDSIPASIGVLDSDDIDYGISYHCLEVGDFVFMATDGLSEAAKHGDYRAGFFGEARIRDFLAEHHNEPLSDIRELLIKELDEFTDGLYLDDVSFLMFRRVA